MRPELVSTVIEQKLQLKQKNLIPSVRLEGGVGIVGNAVLKRVDEHDERVLLPLKVQYCKW